MIRIGMVNYINMAPLVETWGEMGLERDWNLVLAPPSRLNAMLLAGEIDLGFVSSHVCWDRPGEAAILGDLSISANGPVGSVFLFCRRPPEELQGLTVLLSSQSATSVNLVRVLFSLFWRVRPHYVHTELSAFQGEAEGVLAIGDEALRIRQEGSYPLQLDLGEIWKRHTGLPFVFAVCAVRRDVLAARPDEVREIHARLVACRDQGLARLEEISRHVAPRIPMSPRDCLAYLQAMEYDLDMAKQEALARFFSALDDLEGRRGGALPLDILPLSA